nr:cellulose-binding protein [uncultured bacterium]
MSRPLTCIQLHLHNKNKKLVIQSSLRINETRNFILFFEKNEFQLSAKSIPTAENTMKQRSSLSLAISSILGGVLFATSSIAAPSETYKWNNVRIDGGGFVPGIIFNQTEPNLIYARTDIGGAYRWDETTKAWIPLLDWVGWDNWGWNGVLSMATDPVDTNRVYAAVGMYTNSWDPNNGAIIRSSDKGKTWQVTKLPFKVGGNMPGRGMGERLSIDPNKNNIVYFGTEGGNGLWRSTDYGATWAKVSSFTNVGNYAQDPTDVNNYLNHNQGVLWVTFDPTSGAAGSASQTIYVGVADKENAIYRSTDGGTSWARIPGQPTGYLPHKGIYDQVNGVLYIATSDTGGPYDGAKGDVGNSPPALAPGPISALFPPAVPIFILVIVA